MKTPIKLLLIILFLSFNSCSKEENCDNPINCLPPATQTGAGTFGCLINNKPFRPAGSQLGGPTMQIDYTIFEGQYVFNLSADNKKSDEAIAVSIRGQELEENKIYLLSKYERESNFGEYLRSGPDHRTDSIHTGEIRLSRFDITTGIVSGTFWFDAVNENGEIVQIREGRFDMKL